MNPFQVGAEFGKASKRFYDEYREQQTIEDILNRANQQNQIIDNLLPMTLNIKDPQKRVFIQGQLQERQKKQKEVVRSNEIQRISQSQDPIGELLQSTTLTAEDKKGFLPIIGELQYSGMIKPRMAAPNEMAAQDVPDMQGSVDQPVEQEIPRLADGSPDYRNMTDSQLTQALGNKFTRNPSQSEIDRRKERNKQAFESQKIPRENYLKRMAELGSGLNQAEIDLSVIANSMEEGGIAWKDRLLTTMGLTDFTGGKAGAINTATKNFFLSDLERSMGRPNQFLEQVLRSALTSAAQKPTNLYVVQRLMATKTALQRAELQIRQRIQAEAQDSELGYVTQKDEDKVQNEIRKFAEAEEKRLLNDINAALFLSDENKNFKLNRVPQGTKMNPNVWKAFVIDSQGDVEKARQKAAAWGYSLNGV